MVLRFFHLVFSTRKKRRYRVCWRSCLKLESVPYRLAAIGNVGRVADELGNTASVVHRHYKALVKPEEAKRWFSIKPGGQANLIQIKAA